MTIAAANVLPEFGLRRKLTPEELMRLQEPAAIFEGEHIDEDGFRVYIYTVAGWLDGVNVITHEGGCSIGGDVMIIEAESRAQADDFAVRGLGDTIDALHNEAQRVRDAQEALFRLESVGALERQRQATKPDADKSDAFEDDMAEIRPLVGDDIILTVGKH